MDKISVIIPVFNVEPYLGKCLDSVIGQTYKNLEIILINDGSTDNSGGICDKYAMKDHRIIVHHKKNGGVSSARNVGLMHATGKYIGFTDSDDWLEPDMYEVLHNELRHRSATVCIAAFFRDTDTDSVPMKNRIHIQSDTLTCKDMMLFALKRDHYMGFCAYLWNKLFLSDIIADNALFFDESINYGEDVLFLMNVIISMGSAGVYCEKPLYHYYQRCSSIARTEKVEVKTDILTAYKKVENLMNENGYSDISYWARGFYCYHAGVVAEVAYKTGNEAVLRMMKCEIEAHLDDYIATNRDFPEKITRMQRMLCLEL